MKEENNSDEVIGKLIKKRQQENEAFLKLLSAMESKSKPSDKPKSKKKK